MLQLVPTNSEDAAAVAEPKSTDSNAAGAPPTIAAPLSEVPAVVEDRAVAELAPETKFPTQPDEAEKKNPAPKKSRFIVKTVPKEVSSILSFFHSICQLISPPLICSKRKL